MNGAPTDIGVIEAVNHDVVVAGVAAMWLDRAGAARACELGDRSAWRIWPADMADTLQWLPTTDIEITQIDDRTCSHTLVNRSGGSQVRVISAIRKWPVDEILQSIVQ